MSKFGIIGEGITDQITIENILSGFFENTDLDDEIQYLQPPPNKPDGGGWRPVLQYLTLESFRNDVLNNQFVILQIDTDVSERKDFDVAHKDSAGNELSVEALIENIIIRLIANINSGESDFYENHAQRIIFAISVHSLECWLVSYYAEQTTAHNCFDELKVVVNPNEIRVAKKQPNYDKLSQPFLIRENIEIVRQKDRSFDLFIQQLHSIAV